MQPAAFSVTTVSAESLKTTTIMSPSLAQPAPTTITTMAQPQLGDSTSLNPPAPSMQPAASSVMIASAESLKTATIVSPSHAQPATIITTMVQPQLGDSTSLNPPAPSMQPAASSVMIASAESLKTATIVSLTQPVTTITTMAQPQLGEMLPKALSKSNHKTATKQTKNDVMGDTDPTPRRASTRTTDLKWKKIDVEAVDTQPAKKKKTAVKDRWVYVTEEPSSSSWYVLIFSDAMISSLPDLYYGLDFDQYLNNLVITSSDLSLLPHLRFFFFF